eukprot:2176530-Heterocapsa_arctica.AAC.1
MAPTSIASWASRVKGRRSRGKKAPHAHLAYGMKGPFTKDRTRRQPLRRRMLPERPPSVATTEKGK